MIRIQAQLTETQASQLKRLAAEEGVSVAELLRRGADLVVASGTERSWDDKVRDALSVVGAFRGGPDIAADHDRYLDEAYGS